MSYSADVMTQHKQTECGTDEECRQENTVQHPHVKTNDGISSKAYSKYFLALWKRNS